MKKMIALFLCLVLLLGMTACSGEDPVKEIGGNETDTLQDSSASQTGEPTPAVTEKHDGPN